MPKFMVHVSLKPEECPCEVKTQNQRLKGKTFFCTCSSGTHGGFFELDAKNETEALSWFPEELRKGAKLYLGEDMTVP